MDTNVLAAMVSFLSVLSVTSEKLVEIVKGFLPWLMKRTPEDANHERKRTSAIHAISVVSGLITAWLSLPLLPPFTTNMPGSAEQKVLVYGLLASAGSSFWNSILGYLNQIKSIKTTKAKLALVELKAADLAFRRDLLIEQTPPKTSEQPPSQNSPKT